MDGDPEDSRQAARILRRRIELLERTDEVARWLRRAPKPPPAPLVRALDALARGALDRIPPAGAGCATCPRKRRTACPPPAVAPCGDLRARAEALGRALQAAREGGSDRWADLWASIDRLREGLDSDVATRRAARGPA